LILANILGLLELFLIYKVLYCLTGAVLWFRLVRDYTHIGDYLDGLIWV